MKQPATVSVDVDPLDLHLVGYGFEGLPPDPLAYEVALPRLLEAFARHGVRATFFFVGRDAASQGAAIRRVAEAGHEVASHSLTHPLVFERLPSHRMRRELAETRARLEDAAGTRVLGFRTPNFDFGRRTAAMLVATGHRYDASGYPTPLLLAARALLALKSSRRAAVLRMRFWPFALHRTPHSLPTPAGNLAAFPVSVSRWMRWPLYHTLRHTMDDDRFERALDGFAQREEPLSYPLHAVDAVGLVEDGADERLAAHPGMGSTLERKLDLLDRSLAAIATRFETVSFRDRLDALSS